ncbi:PIN domain-containing protein [Ereboglobus sp. PH5-5]|uniref:PIN domain-containing protein n=1 Tax=Ereboglobus sp. PH5-5 TaxID=2940529 RepID=UPI002405B436|nr:PIN domain-containing protein [Ereboglobus sp. PH5-5]
MRDAPGFLVDTSVFIRAEKGVFDLAAYVGGTPGVFFAMSSVTATELLTGVARVDTAARRRRRSAFVEQVILQFPVLDFSLPCARQCADMTAILHGNGIIVGIADLMIAATALHHGYGVATFNTRDFHRMPGLVVDTPPVETGR